MGKERKSERFPPEIKKGPTKNRRENPGAAQNGWALRQIAEGSEISNKKFLPQRKGPPQNKEGKSRGGPKWTGLETNLKAISC